MINPMAFITPWATLALTTCESTDISDDKFKPAPAGDVLPVFKLSGPQTGSVRKISALPEQAFFRYVRLRPTLWSSRYSVCTVRCAIGTRRK